MMVCYKQHSTLTKNGLFFHETNPDKRSMASTSTCPSLASPFSLQFGGDTMPQSHSC